MKRMIASALGLLVSASAVLPGFAHAADQPFVVRGKTEQGRLLVPVRLMSAGLGVDVDWNQKTQTITLSGGDLQVVLKTNSNQATVNGQRFELDVPARAEQGVTYVPIRFASQALGGTVSWNSADRVSDVSLGDRKVRVTSETTFNRSEIPQSTVDALVAKANEATDLKAYAQIRSHFTPYFANAYLNKLIREKGLAVAEPFEGEAYSNSDRKTGTIAQYGSPDGIGGMIAERTIAVEKIGGKWQVVDIRFTYIAP